MSAVTHQALRAVTDSAGWITVLLAKFAGSFTSSARYGCPNITAVKRHRRHIHGTSERPAIYATYAIYGPPMRSADTDANARLTSRQRRHSGPVSLLEKNTFLGIFR
jgi:hypothetical protein